MRAGIIAALVVAVVAGTYYLGLGRAPQATAPAPGTPAAAPMAEVRLPADLPAQARIGQTAYEAKCALCHGLNAAGQAGVAPPLVHKVYEPSHHGDEAFQRAVAIGVRQHHWSFGDMPPVEGLTRAEVTTIIAYVRALQRENGID